MFTPHLLNSTSHSTHSLSLPHPTNLCFFFCFFFFLLSSSSFSLSRARATCVHQFRLFEENDIALVMCGLDIVERLLALPSLPHGGASDDVERDADMMDGPHLIESSDGILALEQLQFRFSSDGAAGSGDIYTRTSGLLDTYFGEAYGDEDAGGYDGGFDAGEWSSAAWDVTLAMGAAGVSAAAAVAPPPRPTTKPAWMT